MNTRIISAAITGALLTGACAAPQTATTNAAASASGVAPTSGPVALKSGDVSALSGLWSGPYVFDNGFRGNSKLRLTPTSATTVDGVFEYFWGAGNYDRTPNEGAIEGVVKADGGLHFGDWDLTLSREDEHLIFRTRQKLGGSPANLKWRKAVGPLPSEGG